MKTVFNLYNGDLQCELRLHDKHNSLLKVFNFNFDSINNWYPLNCEYNLLYKVEDNALQLVPTTKKELLYVDYGINLNVNPMLQYDVSKGLNNLVIKQVQRDNTMVCSYANELSLPNWLDSFTYQDVLEGIKVIEKQLDELTNAAITLYYYELPQDDKPRFNSYVKKTKERLALANLSDANQRDYILLGKLYVMFNIMRKVSKLYA